MMLHYSVRVRLRSASTCWPLMLRLRLHPVDCSDSCFTAKKTTQHGAGGEWISSIDTLDDARLEGTVSFRVVNDLIRTEACRVPLTINLH